MRACARQGRRARAMGGWWWLMCHHHPPSPSGAGPPGHHNNLNLAVRPSSRWVGQDQGLRPAGQPLPRPPPPRPTLGREARDSCSQEAGPQHTLPQTHPPRTRHARTHARTSSALRRGLWSVTSGSTNAMSAKAASPKAPFQLVAWMMLSSGTAVLCVVQCVCTQQGGGTVQQRGGRWRARCEARAAPGHGRLQNTTVQQGQGRTRTHPVS